MNGQPVAYIRRSVATRADPGDVSKEFQTERVRALANGDGASLRIIDADWGKSAGRKQAHLRAGFLAMLEDVERGGVSAVYAYSTDRLARDVEASVRLLNACERAGAAIITSEGRFAPGDQMARQMFLFRAMTNEGALDEMERKAKSSSDTRKNRGEVTGGRAYGEVRTLKDGTLRGANEDPELVVRIFREEGSYFAAAKRLNDESVPARSGGLWYARTVQRIVNRQDPASVRRGRKGARSAAGQHTLAGLLRCHCGALMGRTVSGEGTPRYRCSVGASSPAHPRPYIVPERALLPWVKAEAARLRVPGDVTSFGDRDDARRAGIVEERRRLALAFARGGLDDATYGAEDAGLVAELAALDARGDLVSIPGAIDWTWPPEAVNAGLRAIWKSVQLGPDLRPVSAAWRVPEWRR